ncbi:MAG TPA: PHP domain-containing protein, partial [Rubrivivax sp.]|nr:PHP domain-containing protein [Rubrivivax sp.]
MAFVHLRTHTEYSVVDGTLRVADAAAAARGDGQGALAISDVNNLFGAVKFYSACRSKGVKPIIGVDLIVEPLGAEKQPGRLLLLVQDRAGYLNVCELLARGWVQNAQRGQAWIKWDWLAECSAGLIALSGADLGHLGSALLSGDGERAQAVAARLSNLFPQRFYIELQRAGLPSNEVHVRAAVQLAAALQLPVVATHPVQFLTGDDFEAHEARVCIAEGETLGNARRQRRFTREQYFKSQAQMEALFADVPSALANSVQIAQRCNLKLVLGKPQLPDFPTPLVDGQRLPIEAYFRKVAHEGLDKRLLALYPDGGRRDTQRQRYVDRLEFELDTIIKMGFPGYFLIVSDFIVWAKENGCPVGPGRGSGAGSLVAYALFITDLDPLEYGLLF